MSVGQDFPVLGPGGVQKWWVINQISRSGGPRGPQQTNYVVTESVNRPVNEVAGPFSTKAEAQAWQTSANTAGNSPGSVAGGVGNSIANATGIGAIGDLAHKLTESQTWVRVGEFLAGGMLLYVGAKAFFPATVNTVTSGVKRAGKAAAFL